MTDPKDARIKELLLKELKDQSTEKWNYKAECAVLENSLREACEALEFYSTKRNWGEPGPDQRDWYLIESTDRGDRARTTLTKLRERHKFLRDK